MADDVVKVSFIGDASSLNKAIDDVDRNTSRMSDSFSRVKDTAIGVFTGAALLGGVEKLGGALMSASKAAREDEAAQAQLKQALQNTVGATDQQVASVEKWISKTQNATGVLDDKLRPALGTLLRATNDVGKAQSLMSLAMDISQATGKDLESVSLALAKAHEGNVGGLQRLGISLKGANGETMDFASAQAELAELFGGAVATNLNTVEGRTQLLQARMADLQEEVGTRVNVAILAFADFMQQRVVPAIQVVVEWVRDHWPEIRDTIEDVMTRVREVITTVLETVHRFWNTWGDEIMLVVRTVFDFIRTWIESTLNIIRGVINVIMGLIHGDFSQVWEGIKQIFEGVWQYIQGLVHAAMGLLEATISAGMTVIAGIFDAAWGAVVGVFSSAWETMKNVTLGAVNEIIGFFDRLGGAIYGFSQNFAKFISGFGSQMAEWLTTVWQWGEQIVTWFRELPNRIMGFFGGLAETITAPFRAAFNGIAHLWNSTVGSLSFSVPDWIPGLGGHGWSVPDIPEFDTGGIMPGPLGKPGLALLHGGETVLPTHRTPLPTGGGTVINMVFNNLRVDKPATVDNLAATMSRELAVALRGSVT